MKRNQKEAFVSGEGDNFFQRNRYSSEVVAEMARTDLLLKAVKELDLKPKKVLEVGCANGWRLNILRQELGCECSGIEPSELAVDSGRQLFPEIQLSVGSAEELPFPDGQFDLVLYGFCLYLCDRKDLFRIASEGNRVLRDGGKIGIVDFDSRFPYKNTYKHSPGLFSYKMQYHQMFLWNPQYSLDYYLSVHHEFSGSTSGGDDPDNVISVAVVSKSSDGFSVTDPFLAAKP